MKSLPALLLCACCAVGLAGCGDVLSGTDESASNTSEPAKATKTDAKQTASPQEVFRRRILPIMNSKQASSCTECHLSGVALQAYIHSDQATTFAALRKDGLIDVKNPEKSKILTFIARKPKKPNPITDKIRKQEYDAFKAWLIAAAKDPKLLKASSETTLGTKLPLEVIRHARKDRVLSSFVDNVWSQVGRCVNCHSPNRNARQVKKHGEQMSWIVPNDPAGTLRQLVEAGNIDTDSPADSSVLTKPAGQEKHGGGPKFLVGGPAYRGFLRFLTDYAAVTNGKYKSTKDLPKPSQELVLLGKQHLRILNMPAAWHELPLRVDLYRWDKPNGRWSKDRWATAFGRIHGKRKIWQSLIAVTASRDSARAKDNRKTKLLPAGTYLAKLYVDFNKKTAKDPQYELDEKDFVGQVEFTGRWKPGYQPPKIIRAPKAVHERAKRD